MGDFCDHRIFLGDPNRCERTTQVLSATAQTSVTNKKRSIFGAITLHEENNELSKLVFLDTTGIRNIPPPLYSKLPSAMSARYRQVWDIYDPAQRK